MRCRIRLTVAAAVGLDCDRSFPCAAKAASRAGRARWCGARRRPLRPSGQRQARARLDSTLCVVLRRSRLELEADEPLVADHPRVVAGLDDVRLARTDLDFGAVLVLDGQPARVHNADMA